MPRSAKPNGVPVQFYIPEEAAEFLRSIVAARKQVGDNSVSIASLAREALARQHNLDVAFFETGERFVRGSAKKSKTSATE